VASLLWSVRRTSRISSSNPPGVGHQVPQADGLAESRRDFKSRYLFTSASMSNLPCSANCIIEIQVNNLEIEAKRNIVVSGSTGFFFATSEKP